MLNTFHYHCRVPLPLPGFLGSSCWFFFVIIGDLHIIADHLLSHSGSGVIVIDWQVTLWCVDYLISVSGLHHHISSLIENQVIIVALGDVAVIEGGGRADVLK